MWFFTCSITTIKVKYSSDPLKIPVSCENTVSFLAPFSLQATINHFGTLQERHYWSFKSDKHASKWLKCNDKSATPVQQKSLTIFGCDNPTYNPSPIQENQVCALDFSGLTYLQYPSFHEKHCKGTCLTSLVFVVWRPHI